MSTVYCINIVTVNHVCVLICFSIISCIVDLVGAINVHNVINIEKLIL